MESASISRPARAHYRQQLDRTLHVFSNTILSFASIGPTGTVFAFAPIALIFGGSLTFVAFLIAALVIVCQGLCYAECGTAYPIAGGEYAITARVVAKPVGAVLLADMIALYVFVPSAFALGGSIYLGVLWPWAGTHPHLVGVVLLAIGAFVAFLRLAVGWIIAAIFLGIELVAIPVIVVLGLVHAHNPIDRWFTNIGGYADGKPFTVTFTAMVLAITFAFFCYQGFGNALALSEETQEAKKKVGRAVMWTVLVAIIGIGAPVAALLLGAPSLEGLLTAPAPFTYFLTELGGTTVDKVVSLFVFFAILDAIVASTMAFGRVVWSSGRDKAWPGGMSRALAAVHPRLKTPYVATTSLAVAAILLTAFSNLAAVVTFLGIITLMYAGLMGLSAFVIRFRKDSPQRYMMPLWPVAPLVLMAACVLMATQQTLHDLTIVLSVLGAYLIYYLVWCLPRPTKQWVLLDAIVEGAPDTDAQPQAVPGPVAPGPTD